MPLEAERVTIGKAPGSDVVLDDPTVSRVHAVIERVGQAHAIRDLGSRNGTTVNGARVFGEQILKPGDEIRLGKARLIYRGAAFQGLPTTPVEEAPRVTPRERDVLIELCRPLVAGTMFTEPATVGDISRVLFITEAAVRMHLSRLFAKFGVDESAPGRRAILASAAIDRGVVRVADLEAGQT